MCDECQTLLHEARERRAWLAAHGEDLTWWTHNRVRHWNPYYHVGSYYGHEWATEEDDAPTQDNLQSAFVDLIGAVAQGEESVDKSIQYASFHDPFVLDTLGRSNRDYSYHRFFLTKSAREAINALHLLVAKMLPAAYRAGERAGRSVLHQLADGKVSVVDFNGQP